MILNIMVKTCYKTTYVSHQKGGVVLSHKSKKLFNLAIIGGNRDNLLKIMFPIIIYDDISFNGSPNILQK